MRAVVKTSLSSLPKETMEVMQTEGLPLEGEGMTDHLNI